MKINWKTIAIIFIALFVAETSFIAWAVHTANQEEERNYECLYDFCSNNYDALYEGLVCTCYDLDVIGNYVVAKTKYMKGG